MQDTNATTASLFQDTTYIYIVAHSCGNEMHGPVKIGITKSLHHRLSGIQTGSYKRLAYQRYFSAPNRDIAKKIERETHESLSNRRLEGEWFDISPLEAIEALVYVVFDTMEAELGEDDLMEALVDGGAIDGLYDVNNGCAN